MRESWIAGEDASLEDILERRERRAEEQRALLARGGESLVSFTMNIPGARKRFPLAAMGFQEGCGQLRRIFREGEILEERRRSGPTGDEVLLLLNVPARPAKERAVALEEAHPLGRLWDMDVLSPSGEPLSRRSLGLSERRCLVCGGAAKACARGRRHGVELPFHAAANLLLGWFRDGAADRITACAVRALLTEVSVTPKPGLVDLANNGSHRDMSFSTFLDSAAALAPWFGSFFRLGWEDEDGDGALFARLRFAGQGAEKAMFAATGGVNTHKGLVFSMAVLCGALGRLCAQTARRPLPMEQLTAASGALAGHALRDFDGTGGDTAGLRCFRELRISGIRGEAAAGFPSVINHGLPVLERWMEGNASLNDAACAALLSLIAHVADTNMLRRGGPAEALCRRQEAEALFNMLTPENLTEALAALDRSYIRKNLSPGGCADLLALTLMLRFLKEAGIVG